MTTSPPRRDITDAATMKALAHPLRQRIQSLLVQRGPATATTLARALGESTGATSYHLRQLARYGLVEEAPELAHGRERWWRRLRLDLRFPRRSQQSPEMRAVLGELERAWFNADLESYARFQRERDQMGAWGDALLYSRGGFQVTREELVAFFEEYMALLKRYQRPPEEVPPGARNVLVRFVAFPEIEPAAPDTGDEPPPTEETDTPTT